MLSDGRQKHYADKRTSLECLETMILTFGAIQTAFFCLMNAHKYLFRFDLKDSAVDDLNKAIHYTELTAEIVDKYCSVSNDIVSEHILPHIDTYATMAKQLLKDWHKAHDASYPVMDTSRAVFTHSECAGTRSGTSLEHRNISVAEYMEIGKA